MSTMPDRFKNDEEVKLYNPWGKLAKEYSHSKDCLFGENNKYYCVKDEAAIQEFNDKWGKDKFGYDTTEKLITTIPAEPWGGNPLKAKLIILSLNPGYVPEVNGKLAQLLQSNEIVRNKIIDYKKKTLELEAESFLPEEDYGEPISCRDAVNMLGDWYWYKKLKPLQKDVKEKYDLDEDDFYKQIALVEYHGYSSITSEHDFPLNNKYLESQEFIKRMVSYLAEVKKTRFLIMRSVGKWKKLLGKELFQQYKESGIILCKENKGMSQAITENNLKGVYKIIKEIFKPTPLLYTDKMRERLLDIIKSTAGFELRGKVKGWIYSENYNEHCLRLIKDGVWFEIITSDLYDEIVYKRALKFFYPKKYNENGSYVTDYMTLSLDVCIANIAPKNVCDIVDGLCQLINKYKTYDGFEDIKSFAIKHNMKAETSDDADMWDYKLASMYMKEKRINDIDNQFKLDLMMELCHQVLEEMTIDEEDD